VISSVTCIDGDENTPGYFWASQTQCLPCNDPSSFTVNIPTLLISS